MRKTVMVGALMLMMPLLVLGQMKDKSKPTQNKAAKTDGIEQQIMLIEEEWEQASRNKINPEMTLNRILADDWFFGLRLETSTNPRSTNITFGDDSGVNGPFSKDSDRINVGQKLKLPAGRGAVVASTPAVTAPEPAPTATGPVSTNRVP